MATESKYVIVRTCSAGVFAGFLKSRKGQEVVLTMARRLWYWKGAASLSQLSVDGVASLSQLSVDGVACPKECRFPIAVPEVTLLQAIEILPVSAKAKKSIEGVPVWSM